ncbi:hypothetical protein [Pseudomonas sp. GW460-C8]|uniref:hypothetical protein n=1 Tax=Pseudomonas sp. GW460-C8 TaxID=2070589 RepID=UPI0015A82957|nr:hypothetical protein [Pseudomonas sp. GW460-C8]
MNFLVRRARVSDAAALPAIERSAAGHRQVQKKNIFGKNLLVDHFLRRLPHHDYFFRNYLLYKY